MMDMLTKNVKYVVCGLETSLAGTTFTESVVYPNSEGTITYA